MKAIFVTDMPKRCYDCPCYNGITCRALNVQIGFASAVIGRKYECPFIQLPSRRKSQVNWLEAKINTHELTEYDKGWNDCIEYLERREE